MAPMTSDQAKSMPGVHVTSTDFVMEISRETHVFFWVAFGIWVCSTFVERPTQLSRVRNECTRAKHRCKYATLA